MVTVFVCSKFKTSWKSFFSNKARKYSPYFVGIFNKTIIPLTLVGYEMINGYLLSHIQRALVVDRSILNSENTHGFQTPSK